MLLGGLKIDLKNTLAHGNSLEFINFLLEKAQISKIINSLLL